ncbi:methyltransferase domain-containing protein [Algoriphagus zhangzhouensis]|uniref:Methyltransferase domain-containing protein n=1 Tax=Algoriphagus zhangzhouensis TaxID=1073327 RepID=A0A1M7ZKI9_9BACT|nr:class I SAM-dependent methyltransferase [Algoriphagus zhangzhouensis]TDY42878.1 methyltransferase family protein [Algoriphagus zhangzhouensis]SHO65391.1 Methyltransferase domain-containing protein [Algoriphagus zhangzhouensis]
MIDFNPSQITFENVDRFFIKKSIFQFISEKSNSFSGNLIDVGCGQMPYREFITQNSLIETYTGIDLIGGNEYHSEISPDLLWDGITFPIQDESYNSALATEVLEHCPDPQVTLKEIFRILKPGSPIVLTVPFIWPTHESPHDYYRYTPFGLRYQLEEAGFEDVRISCLGGWDASLAQVLGLWIKRRKMSMSNQKRLFVLIKPFIQFLLRKDRILESNKEQNLFTNLGAMAWKK